QLLEKEKVVVRRVIAPEKHLVCDWVMQAFGAYWHSEVEVAFSRQPVSCWIAQRGNAILGFACYESTARNFFGPTGTLESALAPQIIGIHAGNGLCLCDHRWCRSSGIL
ncbi:MAG: GNAT family N-acetyltransferase, partial [Algoriphagus sp.]